MNQIKQLIDERKKYLIKYDYENNPIKQHQSSFNLKLNDNNKKEAII